MVYVTTLSVVQTVKGRMRWVLMNSEVLSKEMAVTWFELLPLRLAGGTEENYDHPVRTASLQPETWTRDLPNTKKVYWLSMHDILFFSCMGVSPL
jgi:hypothetical protein